jgi:hypothetical protein
LAVPRLLEIRPAALLQCQLVMVAMPRRGVRSAQRADQPQKFAVADFWRIRLRGEGNVLN